jgi:hypothetical protein
MLFFFKILGFYVNIRNYYIWANMQFLLKKNLMDIH